MTTKKTGFSKPYFWNFKNKISFDENEVSSSIDDILTEEECWKIVAENADKDQEDLTADPSSSIIPPDDDQKVKRQCCTNRCTNTVDEDNYYHRLAGKSDL